MVPLVAGGDDAIKALITNYNGANSGILDHGG